MNTQNENSVTDQTKNKKYVFVQRDGDDFSCIKITEGTYKNVIYTYGHVQFAPTPNANDEIPLKFDYDIKSNPFEVDVRSEDFKNFIGDILVEVVERQLNDGKLDIKE